ncbi:long-chain-fatty-acid--CoA ligase [Bacillus massilinigeriensis]|uniref:long-chain-fatty-acid--CoA ligase n=1 Tax=Bacillus massilionigeriensis TaxID=1805475 RepID=UPI00096ADA2A|nr:long-chain fatty acid--CoA ligase [Bacillus massilionigeriensis]
MNLKGLLETNIEQFGEYPFLYFHDKQYTNVETKMYSDSIANGLKELGIDKGDRVMICMPNCPEVLFAYQGIIRAGAIIVPIMYMLHPKEIHYIALNSGVKAVITTSHIVQNVELALEGLPSKPILIVVDQPTNERAYNLYDIMKDQGSNENIQVKPDDTAVILYTSGTTGNPKGVLLTHRNLYSNAENSVKHNETERGTTLGVLPLAHVYGLTISNICYLTGSSIVIFSKFDLKSVFEAIEKYKVRTFSAVPAMIHAMCAYPLANQYDTSSLESVGSGSAPLPVALLNAFQQKFGAVVLEGYGLSEAAPIVTAHLKDQPVKPGSVGLPIPGVEVKIVNENRENVPIGEIGELAVRGDNVTPGYFQNDEETKRVLKDGWLYTGDMARLDADGYLYIVDRKKDLIIRGGFNIYPRDVEELLTAHELVSEAAVVGIPDERMGEEMVACIVKKTDSFISEEEIIQYCQDHLAKNKTPKKVLFVESLPRNGVGKILKTHLRKTAAEIIAESTNETPS